MKNLFHKKINSKHIFLFALLTIAQSISPITAESVILLYQKEFNKLRTNYHLSNKEEKTETAREFGRTLAACQNNDLSSSYCREKEETIKDLFYTHPCEEECEFYEILQTLQALREKFHNTTDMAEKKELLKSTASFLAPFSESKYFKRNQEKILSIFFDSRCENTFKDSMEPLYIYTSLSTSIMNN